MVAMESVFEVSAEVLLCFITRRNAWVVIVYVIRVGENSWCLLIVVVKPRLIMKPWRQIHLNHKTIMFLYLFTCLVYFF